jgi:hypothetical protein
MNDFDVWMKKVDAALELVFGFSSEDLPDLCYMDYFDDEMEPNEVVEEMCEVM